MLISAYIFSLILYQSMWVITWILKHKTYLEGKNFLVT